MEGCDRELHLSAGAERKQGNIRTDIRARTCRIWSKGGNRSTGNPVFPSFGNGRVRHSHNFCEVPHQTIIGYAKPKSTRPQLRYNNNNNNNNNKNNKYKHGYGINILLKCTCSQITIKNNNKYICICFQSDNNILWCWKHTYAYYCF